jgi:peptide/nickel transport system substrate-binding protein
MSPRRPTDRSTVTVAGALMLLGLAWALPRAGFGQAQGPAATKGDILSAEPFDRLTLIDNNVMTVEPVSPRPLPPYDAKKEAEKKRSKKEVPREGNIGVPGVKVEMPGDEGDDGAEIVIHLTDGGEVRDFIVKRSSIRSVEYFEDMLLAEGERLTLAKDFNKAFECYLRVRARDPKWKGLDDHVNALLFAEGSAALLDGDGERGLRLLRELWARKRDYPGLADRLASSYSARATHALDLGLFALGRKILHDAEPLAPGHPSLKAVRERFLIKARGMAGAASRKEGAARVDDLAEALRVWPTLEKADAAYREAFAAWPTLEVAVTDVPRTVGPWVSSPADERVSRLVYLPTLARDDDEAAQGKAEGQLAASVETADLGRRIVVKLRHDINWSDRSRPVGLVDLARSLTDAADPGSPRYVARWADLLDRVETPDNDRVEVRLTRPLLRPGAWLLGPVGPAHAGSDGRVATVGGGRELVGNGPYLWLPVDSGLEKHHDRAELRAAGPPSGSAAAVKIRRVREVRYPSAAAALGAFNRGEVALLEHVSPDRLAELAKNDAFKVGRYARPALHRIAVDGRNPALRKRELRRGLSYAIDRRTLLEETLLRRPVDAANLPSDGVFPRGNFADAPDVAPLGYDPMLARMLVAGVKRELGGKPIELTFEYPAVPEAQAVAPKLAEAFKAAGVQIKAVERPESGLESELRAGRRFDLAYRVSKCDDPTVDAGPLISPSYDAAPSTDPLGSVASPRILQLLLLLERAPEFPTAKGLAVQIDRECRDELPVLPLWQLEDHYAWHSRLKGPAEEADRLYQNLATWEVEPWFAKDPW